MSEAIIAIYKTAPVYDIESLEFDLTQVPSELCKLRIVYDDQSYSCEYLPYQLTPKQSLKLVFDDEIFYHYKSIDRSHLESLYNKRGEHDDIVIVKNSLLTDSYYCNLALEKEGVWYTPLKPLLAGTKRAQLLEDEKLVETNINVDELFQYSKIRLFNAMIDFGEVEIPISQLW